MAGTIFQIRSSDHVVRMNWYTAINAIQSIDVTPAFNEEYAKELGTTANFDYTIQPEVAVTMESLGTGSTVAYLRYMMTQFNTGTGEFEGFRGGAPNAATPNEATLTGDDLEFVAVDLIESKKANEEFIRSSVLPRCQLSSLSFRADANGTASETYNFEGELQDIFLKPWHDVISIPLTRNSSTELQVPDDPALSLPYEVAITGDANVVNSDWVLAYIMIDEVKVQGEAANVVANWTGASFDGTLTLQSPLVAPLGARLSAIIFRKTPGNMPTLSTPPSGARTLRAHKISIWLVDPADIDLYAEPDLNAANVTAVLTDARLVLRCQTADVNIDLRREALRQIKKSNDGSIYYRAATYPLDITVGLTAFETDLFDWQRIQGKTFSGSEASTAYEKDKILNLVDFETPEWQIVMRYYRDDQVIQTMAVTDARVNGAGQRNVVEGRAEITWGFTGSLWKITGDTWVDPNAS